MSKQDQQQGGIVLLVDDNPQNLSLLFQILEPKGYECILCQSTQEARVALENERPDIILLDVMMPEEDGFSLCREIRQNHHYNEIPILFVTARTEGESIQDGFMAGANDYITKPVNALELLARVTHQISLVRAQKLVNEKNKELERLVKALEKASTTDALTQLYNRRYMLERLESEVARYERRKSPFCLVIGDIDHFKHVNDQYGHDCGDYVLREIADTLQGAMRNGDTVARWGGEEFLMLLPDTEDEGALIMAERIRNLVARQQFQYIKKHQDGPVMHRFTVTMTLGIAAFEPGMGIDQAIIHADEALFKGKEKGCDCIIVYKYAEKII